MIPEDGYLICSTEDKDGFIVTEPVWDEVLGFQQVVAQGSTWYATEELAAEWIAKKLQEPEEDEEELWNADPNCVHEIYGAPGGGIKCRKCTGWFCF